MESKVSSKINLINSSDIHPAIEILKEEFGNDISKDYIRLAQLISNNFDCICTVKQIVDYYEFPNYEEIILDKELIYSQHFDYEYIRRR